MKKIAFVLHFLLIAILAQAQPAKKLTLETAIMQEYRDLYPDDLSGIEWISPGTFAHRGDKGALLIRNLKGDTLQTITPDGVNAILNTLGIDSVKAVRPAVWLTDGRFLMRCGGDMVVYNSADESLQWFLHFPDKAENVEISDKTGYVAYTIDKDVYVATPRDSAIQITHHGDTEVSAGVAIHRSEFGITKGLFWANDGLKLGFYEMDESMVTDYPLVDYTTVPATPNPIKYPMAGQKSHHARVGIFNTAGNELIYLKTGEPLDHYLTNFCFSPDGSRAYLAEINRDQNHMDLNIYNTANGDRIKTLFSETNDKYVEPENPPYFPDDKGDAFVWQSERDGFNHLYLYTSEGKLLRQLTRGNFDILSIDGRTVDGKTLIVTAADGLMDRAVYSVSVKNGKMIKLTSQPGMYAVKMKKGDTFIQRHTSADIPGETSLVSVAGDRRVNLVEAKDPLADYQLGEVEFPVLQASDGTPLQARLIKPYDFDPDRKYPVLVYVYGGPHVQLVRNDYKGGASLWMYEMANRGYIVFTVDGRGSANRGLAFEQATFRRLGTVEMEDQLEGVKYLKSLSYVNADKMAVHGWSFGGFMTTSLMLRHPGVFKTGVAGGPVTDWRLYEVMYTERYMDTPEQNPEGYEEADLKNYVKNLDGNLLMIHGLDDNVVVPQHAFTLIKRFVDAGVQTQFFPYPGHEHNVRGKDRVHLMTKVLDYVDTHFTVQ